MRAGPGGPLPRLPAALVERYLVRRELGRGGMGRVLLAQDRNLDRTVAVKVMHRAGDPLLRARFLREARTLASLAHRGLTEVFDFGVEEDVPFLVTEFLEGVELGALPPEVDPLEVLWEVAEVLEVVHQAGVLHRDVKPANILRTSEGRVVLLDFGLASARGGPRVTRTGQVLGTAAYLAPEVVSEARWSPAADWYAWGVTLYQVLMGRPPWAPALTLAMAAGAERPPLDLGELDPDHPAVPLLEATLRADPQARASDLAALRAAATPTAPTSGGAATSSSPGPPPSPRPEATTRRPAVGLLGLAGLVALIAAGVWDRAPAPAGREAAPPPRAPGPSPSRVQLEAEATRLGRVWVESPCPDPEEHEPAFLAAHLLALLPEVIDPRFVPRVRRYLQALEAWLTQLRQADRPLDPDQAAAFRRLALGLPVRLWTDVERLHLYARQPPLVAAAESPFEAAPGGPERRTQATRAWDSLRAMAQDLTRRFPPTGALRGPLAALHAQWEAPARNAPFDESVALALRRLDRLGPDPFRPDLVQGIVSLFYFTRRTRIRCEARDSILGLASELDHEGAPPAARARLAADLLGCALRAFAWCDRPGPAPVDPRLQPHLRRFQRHAAAAPEVARRTLRAYVFDLAEVMEWNSEYPREACHQVARLAGTDCARDSRSRTAARRTSPARGASPAPLGPPPDP